jgi:hypothetical protein
MGWVALGCQSRHAAALKEIDRLRGTAPGTEGADRLDILVALVERSGTRIIAGPSPTIRRCPCWSLTLILR